MILGYVDPSVIASSECSVSMCGEWLMLQPYFELGSNGRMPAIRISLCD